MSYLIVAVLAAFVAVKVQRAFRSSQSDWDIPSATREWQSSKWM